jgi:hypothetical protein
LWVSTWVRWRRARAGISHAPATSTGATCSSSLQPDPRQLHSWARGTGSVGDAVGKGRAQRASLTLAQTSFTHAPQTSFTHAPTDRHTGRRVRSSSSTEATGASHKRARERGARERGARERGARERSKRGRSKRGDQTQRRPPAPRPAPLLPPPRRLLLVHVCVPRKCVPWPTLWPTVPPPTDPVGQSWPRGTRSVGDSVGEGYYSVKHLAVLLECETPSSADARSGADARKSCIVQAQRPRRRPLLPALSLWCDLRSPSALAYTIAY